MNKLYFNVLDPQSVNYIFGGKGYNYYPNVSSPDNAEAELFKSTRNNNIGYYTYCRTLYTKP